MNGRTIKLLQFQQSFYSLFRNLSITKNFPKTTLQKENPEIPSYIATDEEYKTGKKLAVSTLAKLFEIRPFVAKDIVDRNNNLSKVNKVFIINTYMKYKENGVTNNTLLKYPKLLTETDLDNKIVYIRKLSVDINDSIILVLLPYNKLVKFVREECYEGFTDGKITILTNYLQISKQEACELIARKTFLCSLSSSVIAAKLKLLLEFGTKPENIKKDLWVLRYSTKQITCRLNEAKNHNLGDIKTWMVRAQPDIFQHYMQRRSDNKLILGNSSLAEYLSERLKCSIDVANYIIDKQPVLKNKSLKKIKDLLDCLLSAGFKPIQICRVPKILVHSVETTSRRLKQLEDKDIKIDSLSMLTKSQREFNLQYEILLKNKNKMQNT